MRGLILSRGLRLFVFAVLVAVFLPSGRFIVWAALAVVLLVQTLIQRRREGGRAFFVAVGVVLCLVAAYVVSSRDVHGVNVYRETHRPIGDLMQRVQDGTYQGTGMGFRNAIGVEVAVADHRITDIRLTRYQDLVSVKDNVLSGVRQAIVDAGRVDVDYDLGMFRGAHRTYIGFIDAVQDALIKGIPDYPRYHWFSQGFFTTFLGDPPTHKTLNALAILFAVFLVFDYVIQGAVVKDTGQVLTCYNCGTCVGTCPVKMVEGYQFPMDLVLLTRLGDYDRVEELSRYCVGCGRCTVKCPVGISGPSVISAAFRAKKEQQRARTRKAA